MKLVADKNIPYLEGVLNPYFKEVLLLPANEITSDVVNDADALLVRTRTICNAKLLEGSKVKFIGSATIGYDHIDINYCNSRGIEWVNAPGCNSGGVQQWVGAAFIELSNQLGFNLKSKTLGVVGVGNVGKKVVDIGSALGMKTLCCDPPRKRDENLPDFVDLKTIAQQSDIVTFHVPLTRDGIDATFHIVDENFINSLKKDVIILNSSRGEVVDTESLIRSLNQKKLNAVALDVWENEPNISLELLNLVNIATPHVAGYSLEGKVKGTSMVIDSLSRYFNLNIHPWLPSPNPLNKKEIQNLPSSVIQAIKNSYNILHDTQVLRENPGNFEKLRSDYRLRRDFTGYTIKGANNDEEKIYHKLGFGLISDNP